MVTGGARDCSIVIAEQDGRTGFPARLLFAIVVLTLAFLFPSAETRHAVITAVSDAYLQVSVFVAATLGLFYFFEHVFRLDTDYLLRRYRHWQVPVSALMGALPGCGGAIVVITQYVSGRVGFSSVVAVLCSTMGDAAFLLLAREPSTALLVYGLSISAGIVCGYLVMLIHGPDFLRGGGGNLMRESPFARLCGMPSRMSPLRMPWLIVMIPGLALGAGNAFQMDTDLWFGPLAHLRPTMWYGFAGAYLSVIMWVLAPSSGPSLSNLSCNVAGPHPLRCLVDRVAVDANFVTAWVITAFLIYELGTLWFSVDLAWVFNLWQPLLPLFAVLIGFFPGCGPQILVTSLYLGGAVPLSAQIGNAISNDGDALFPAIALAPKAAVLATLYTAVPALLLSYGWYFIMETP